MDTQLTRRYTTNLNGVLSRYDRILIVGTVPGACYADGMTSFLYSRGIRIFDYAKFAEPLRDLVRNRAEQVCAQAGVAIEQVSKSHIRKEELVQRVLASRGEASGLVHVLSAMEACSSYRPWHDKAAAKTYLRIDTGKCLHYYSLIDLREIPLGCNQRYLAFLGSLDDSSEPTQSTRQRRAKRQRSEFLQPD